MGVDRGLHGISDYSWQDEEKLDKVRGRQAERLAVSETSEMPGQVAIRQDTVDLVGGATEDRFTQLGGLILTPLEQPIRGEEA
jgi:hypothetical protein